MSEAATTTKWPIAAQWAGKLAVTLRLIPPQTLQNPALCARHLLEVFLMANFGFLALDIFVAHSTNHFRHSTEWIPFYFSLIAPLLLWAEHAYNLRHANKPIRIAGLLVGILAIAIGILGLGLHLESQFFVTRTLKSLVYTAPFAAPLAYTGLGLLVCLNRLIPLESNSSWARWVLALAWLGFLGNFVLVLADHAQNGFFVVWEWLPVAICAWGLGVLGLLLLQSQVSSGYFRVCAWMLFGQVILGVVGFVWHTVANWPALGTPRFDDFVYGAPVFAPLLFPNLALLAALSLWQWKTKPILS